MQIFLHGLVTKDTEIFKYISFLPVFYTQANVTNTKVIESVQKRSLRWINSTGNNNYKELLYCSRILPLSLYLQLQDLILSKFLTGHFNFNIDQFVYMKTTTSSLWSDNELKFDHSKPRLEICQQSFFFRTFALPNRIPQFENATGLKIVHSIICGIILKRITTN